MAEAELRAADVARIVGCHRNTVTNYSDRGLIVAFRDSNGFRWYTLKEALRLKAILSERSLDVSGGIHCEA